MPQSTPAVDLAREAAPSRAAPSAPGRQPHRFKFYRAGGLDQVALETGADLLALEQLDPKLWVALSCPTKGLELDGRTLELLDLDGDGRVRVPEILAAIRFCAARLRDVGVLMYGADEVSLASLRDDTPEGRAALAAARHVAPLLGPDRPALSADDWSGLVARFAAHEAADYLMVGRNGIFYDRRGRDWNATIVKIVEAPISLRQAFWAPYKKALRLVEEQVARFAQAKQKEADARLETSATHAGDVALHGKPPPPTPLDVGRMVGIVAALGVGIGALGTLLGAFVSGFVGLQPWWAKAVAVGGVGALVSGPSVLIAWLKLRHRTLGPILDANGWAVNGRVLVNLPLGTALTDRAVLPPDARRVLDDPYADEAAKRRRRAFWLVLLLAALALGAARTLHHWPFGPFFWQR